MAAKKITAAQAEAKRLSDIAKKAWRTRRANAKK